MAILNLRAVALGGAALAAAAGVLARRRNRQDRIGAPAPAPSVAPAGVTATEPEPTAPPAIANADAGGPPENTATHVPAPARETAAHEGQVAGVLDDTGGVDEAAEEAAAAAEAANIGGARPDYPGREYGEEADEADRALEEAGEGESEGEELAEYDLQENAEDDFDRRSDAEAQLDEVIEAQDDPLSGEVGLPGPERIDDLDAEQAEQAISQEPDAIREADGGTSAQEKSSAVWRTDDPAGQPTVESPKPGPDAA